MASVFEIQTIYCISEQIYFGLDFSFQFCHYIKGAFIRTPSYSISQEICTRFCFAVLCCGYALTDFPISIRLTSLALWQSDDCPSASKATLMNMDKYFMWIHYERLHNHNKAKHNKTVCIWLGIYCIRLWYNKLLSNMFFVWFCSLLFPRCWWWVKPWQIPMQTVS